MFKNLLNLNLNSEKAEVRLEAIQELNADNAQNQSQLQDMALNDSSAKCRRAAMLKVSDPKWLYEISTHDDLKISTLAKTALVNAIGTKSQLSENEFRDLLSDIPNMTTLIACHCPHGELRTELIDSMPLEQQIDILGELDYTDSRQAIVDRLTVAEDMERARGALRGKDKTAERIVRSKLDALHAGEKQHQAELESATAIVEKLEHMVGLEWRPEFKAAFSVWQQRWQALQQSPPEQLQTRFTDAEVIMEARIKEVTELEHAAKKSASLANSLEAYCTTLAKLSLDELQEQQAAILKIQRNAAEDRVKFLELPKAKAKKMKNDEDRFNLAQNSLTSVAKFCADWNFKADNSEESLSVAEEKQQIQKLAKIERMLEWPADYIPLLAQIEAQEIISDLQAHLEVTQDTSKENFEKINQRINRLMGVATKGNVAMAKRELAAMQKAAGRYQGKEKTQLDERLDRATEVVSNMEDWKDFATEPKYLELCEKMENLVGSKSHPDKLAKEISHLQQTWKQLGTSSSADKHWPRFKEAADSAYAPCAEFFEKRHAQRQKNLALREPFIAELRSLLKETPWVETPEQKDHPDYKSIEQTLQKVHNKWREIKDVEQKPGQKQWKKYSKVRKAIHEKLDVIYRANIEEKHQLILQVESMLETDIKEESLAKLKLLQTKWKQVGVTRRNDDQKAWRKFKKASDAVYAKLQGVRQQKRDEEDAMIAEHKRVIDGIYELGRGAKELVEADKGFELLTSQYKELAPLPKILPERLIEKVQDDYAKANNAFSAARDRLLDKQKKRGADALSDKAAICFELERLADKPDEAQIADLQARFKAIDLSDRDHAKQIETRFAATLDADKSDANIRRRLLCIDLEILLDQESPKEDSAQRMQIQLERMKTKGFGHQQVSTEQALKQMQIDWLCLPGAESSLQKTLNARFEALMAKAPKPKVSKTQGAHNRASNKQRSKRHNSKGKRTSRSAKPNNR